MPRPNILGRLEHDLEELAIENERLGYAEASKEIFLCFTCDPYPKGVDTSTTYKGVATDVTLEAIHLIHGYGFRVKLLTKGAVAARRDLPVLRPTDQFGLTLTFDNAGDSLEWEPNADAPIHRIWTLQMAHERGIKTWVSLEPVIRPTQTLKLIGLTYKAVDHYAVGCWNHDVRTNEIDWPKFGRDAIALLESLGKAYYIKKDLRARLEVT